MTFFNYSYLIFICVDKQCCETSCFNLFYRYFRESWSCYLILLSIRHSMKLTFHPALIILSTFDQLVQCVITNINLHHILIIKHKSHHKMTHKNIHFHHHNPLKPSDDQNIPVGTKKPKSP